MSKSSHRSVNRQAHEYDYPGEFPLTNKNQIINR